MKEMFARTQWLLGNEGMARLAAARVAIFGVGGVGSFVAEGLVRAGVGHFCLIDGDTIEPSNLNRQIHAVRETIGQQKVAAMRDRMMAIGGGAEIQIIAENYGGERAADFFADGFDYVVDAVDMVTAKISLVLESQRRKIPVISSMGTGNKLDPTQFEVADIYATRVCPLARVMRRELRSRGVERLKVVYSPETPLPVEANVPGSVSFVPSVAGLIIAGEVVRDLLERGGRRTEG